MPTLPLKKKIENKVGAGVQTPAPPPQPIPNPVKTAQTQTLQNKATQAAVAPQQTSQGAVGGALEQNLLGRLTPQGGEDAIAARQRADFEAQAGRSRAQLQEDLNRFGIIGGGVSGGDAAPLLGDFEGQTNRGLLDIAANQQLRQDADLVRAQDFSNADAQRQAQSIALGQDALGQALNMDQFANTLQQRQDEFGAELGLRNAESDRAATQQAIDFQALQDQLGLSGRGLDEQARQFDVGTAQQGSQFDRSVAEQQRSRREQARLEVRGSKLCGTAEVGIAGMTDGEGGGAQAWIFPVCLRGGRVVRQLWREAARVQPQAASHGRLEHWTSQRADIEQATSHGGLIK